jgi:hypothetical protein
MASTTAQRSPTPLLPPLTPPSLWHCSPVSPSPCARRRDQEKGYAHPSLLYHACEAMVPLRGTPGGVVPR